MAHLHSRAETCLQRDSIYELTFVTFCEKKSGGLGFAQHPVSSTGLIVRLTDTLEE